MRDLQINQIFLNKVNKYVRTVPEPIDIINALPKRIAIKAIELFSCHEEYIIEHLSIGSTPPTVSIIHITRRQRFIQNLLYKTFGEMFICK